MWASRRGFPGDPPSFSTSTTDFAIGTPITQWFTSGKCPPSRLVTDTKCPPGATATPAKRAGGGTGEPEGEGGSAHEASQGANNVVASEIWLPKQT